ncbi:helix-turn-helix transcriptional regulator [Bacillus siamensis]|uniref:response regulator transcription factor n=1 Tax=Bacillus siamensis TaxID=659243 RepID=UPI00037F1D5A|nr:helix-turn-helix transcriptional regulator [Bacillus siamensis]PAD64425.1 helix-turn-helix transcriptional regulator [Bacillus siamensis]
MNNITKTESEIIELIAKEKSNIEIAEQLGYSQRAIEYHIAKIRKKLNVRTRVGIIVKAFKKELI